MTVKLLTEHHFQLLSLKGGCIGSYESTLVKMAHCWKSQVTAHMLRELSAVKALNGIHFPLSGLSVNSTNKIP